MIPVRQSNEICGNRAHLEARCIVCLRIKRRPSEARVEEQIGRLSRNEMRSVFIAWRTVPAWKREQLGAKMLTGPALVLDYGSTTLIPPGWKFQADRAGNLVTRHLVQQ